MSTTSLPDEESTDAASWIWIDDVGHGTPWTLERQADGQVADATRALRGRYKSTVEVRDLPIHPEEQRGELGPYLTSVPYDDPPPQPDWVPWTPCARFKSVESAAKRTIPNRAT